MPSPPPQIGVTFPRADAWAKARGREKYAADYYDGPDLLWAGAKRAGVAHARLLGVNAHRALAEPGVLAVLTHHDIDGPNRQGVVRRDQPVLVDDKIRHAGDAVALVLAESRQALARALALVAVDFEELPGLFDPQAALAPGAPLIHADNPTGNLLLAGTIQRGEGREALAHCPVVVEADFDVPRQEHAYLETECGWARHDADGLTIVASTQTPFRDRAEVAGALGLSPALVRIVAPYCGGAFGGKDGITVQSLLALAAMHADGRPVKMVWDRRESFLAGAKRHPARLRYRLGADRAGRLIALEASAVYDTGPYDHLGGVVAALGLEHAGGPYVIPNVHLEAKAVYTNNPVGGAFRGFGVPQVAAAMEQTMDMLAARLGVDPLELRRRNAVGRGQALPSGVTIDCSCGLAQCLERAAAHPLWQGRAAWKAAAGPFRRRGVGLAACAHGTGYGPVVPDVAMAKLELADDGRFVVYSGVVDMGQGNASTCLHIVGDLLNQRPEDMELVLPDTARTLNSGSSSASRTTFNYGNALIGAAKAMRQRLLARAADLLMAPDANEMELAPGVVRHQPSGRELPLAMLAAYLPAAERLVVQRWRAPINRQKLTDDPNLRTHGLGHKVFSFAVQMAALEVDELTGQTRLDQVIAFTDCGQVINPQLVEQQMQGGMAQGLGYALWEDYLVRDGLPLTPDLTTYIIPTSLDIPDMEAWQIPAHEVSGPFGLKGAGEIAMDIPLAAVGNALADALGGWLGQAPFTAQRVLDFLQAKQGRQS